MDNSDIWEIVGEIIAIILLIIFGSAIVFFLGWVAGWFAKVTIGNILCAGINSLLAGSATITPSQLPIIGGALAWIGTFFKSLGSSGD